MGVAELKRQSSAIAHHLQNINQNVTSLFTKSIREWTRSEHENSLLEPPKENSMHWITFANYTMISRMDIKRTEARKRVDVVSKLNCFIRAQQSDKSGTFIKNFSFAHQTRTTRDVNLDLSLYARHCSNSSTSKTQTRRKWSGRSTFSCDANIHIRWEKNKALLSTYVNLVIKFKYATKYL